MDSTGKQTSINCCGEASWKAAANFSLECLDDTSFHTWPSEVTETIYSVFSPPGSFCAHTEDARCTARRLAGYCVGQAPGFCCEGPCAPWVSRYKTHRQPPLPLRHPNCGRPTEAVVHLKPMLFRITGLLQNRARNSFSRKTNPR